MGGLIPDYAKLEIIENPIIVKYIVIFIENNYPSGVSIHDSLDDAIKVLCKKYKVFNAEKDEYVEISPDEFNRYFKFDRNGIWCPKDFYDDCTDTNNAFIKEVEVHG